MTAHNNLEESGTFADRPFAELLVEIAHAKFSGALRVGHENHKAVLYFRTGDVVYAATNSKSLRLFQLLLRRELIDAKTISRFPNFANDVEFGASLVAQGIVEKSLIDELTVEQVNNVLVEALQWEDGEWSFSTLVRIREELVYSVDLRQILVDYARCVSKDHIFAQFWNLEENFALAPERDHAPQLQKHEEAVLSNFGERSMDIGQIRARCNLPDGPLLQVLYVLWLGGFIIRRDWNFAFSATRVGTILTARVAKVKAAEELNVTEEKKPDVVYVRELESQHTPETIKLPDVTLSLDQYLAQVEGAETHYEVLGVALDEGVRVIKNAYFSLAKQFHPDRYHRESPEMLKRVQSAFTVVAHAHETLREESSRAAYDDKMRKEMEMRERRKAAGKSAAMSVTDRKMEQALENFEEGISLLNDEDFEDAAKALARAVHYSPENALFQAYLGKALTSCGDQYRHKAEAALNAGVRLDPKNSKIRIMLVDFLIAQKMFKRAEGELKRFLELVPDDKEAMAMLAKVKA
jgi:curved DNA-binding protein CbpA